MHHNPTLIRLTRVVFAIALGCLPIQLTAHEDPSTSDIQLPNGQALASVDFERHVQRLLSRNGCNAADCHGSFQGRGGMRLSLFGYSQEMDYEALAGSPSSGRVDLSDAGDSLILLKPSGIDEHEGGIRFEENSWEYQVIERWIEQGAEWSPGTATVDRLIVHPGEEIVLRPGEEIQLRIEAQFQEGTPSDVSLFTVYRSNNDAIAEVTRDGRVKANRVGDTSIVIEYGGTFQAVTILVPREASIGQPEPSNGEDLQIIDAMIERKLHRLGIAPSALCTDEEFLRRVTLDTIGTLPTVDEVESFLADPSLDKRERKIDELLGHSRHAAVWASKYCDITGCRLDWMERPDELKIKRAQMWHDWLRVRFEQNMPYDELAAAIVGATSRDDETVETWIDREIELIGQAQEGFDSDYANRSSLDLFWRRQGLNGPIDVEDMAELVSTAFLGVRVNCARCHQHPFDQWSQQDYLSFANLFSRVRFDASTELRGAVMDRLDARREAVERGEEATAIPRLQEVHANGPWRKLIDPETRSAPAPAPLGQPATDWDGDPRRIFVEWMLADDNPYFAANFVNRVWDHYLGIGFVEPVDAFSVTNPPSHPELLAQLSREFIESNYDIRALERRILMSRAYQRSAVPNETNLDDERNFSHAMVRTLSAEVALDAMHDVLGTSIDWGEQAAEGTRAIDIGADSLSGHGGMSLQVFGKETRTELCDCNRVVGPILRQSIFMMSDEQMMELIDSHGVAQHWSQDRTLESNVRRMFLATLSRHPNEDELAAAVRHIAEAETEQAAVKDLIWGLLNTREFITNH